MQETPWLEYLKITLVAKNFPGYKTASCLKDLHEVSLSLNLILKSSFKVVELKPMPRVLKKFDDANQMHVLWHLGHEVLTADEHEFLEASFLFLSLIHIRVLIRILTITSLIA